MSVVDEFLSVKIPSVIYKDDCGYCYETMYNEEGELSHHLNVCLSCYQSFCDAHLDLHGHVVQSALNEHHDFFLKLSKVKKQASEERTEKKLKLEIKEKAEDEIYDTLWWLVKGGVCSVDYTTPGLDLTVQDKVAQILRAHSKNFEQMAQSWQLEIRSCKHVESFQMPPGPSDNISKCCGKCDLATNLWLCLHCGHVGCGRQQVGIDGHSHALKHFEEHPDHSLAVKLGSLSDVSADVYCYACDDEVKFANQDEWRNLLAHWNIDLKDKVAQEKTLVELQVEQNMNWDFQMVDSQGHELQHLQSSKEYGCGLINLGNSCYMNSVLQVFFNGGVSKWSVEGLGDFPVDVVYPSTNLKCQLIKLRNAVVDNPARYSKGIKPSSFKACLAGSDEEFQSGRQQDAMEFLSFFVDALDKKIFNSSSTNPDDHIRFMLEDRIECNNCHGVKYISQASEFLQIPLSESEEPQNLIDCLERFFKGETLEFKCPQCKKLISATKYSRFQTYPNTLIINPSRIKLDNWIPVKTAAELTLPGVNPDDDTRLQLGQYKSRGFDSNNETLLPEDDDSAFKPQEEALSQLMEMGFSSNAGTRALFHTGNNDTEAAMNWLFSHVDDSDLNDVFKPDSKSSDIVDPSALESLIAMGLDSKLSRKSLILNKGDINASVEWVFNNMDDDGSIEEEPSLKKTVQLYGDSNAEHAQYALRAVVCHKGNSVHSGHYVAFIKKVIEGQSKWVLYNDEKMVVADDPKNIEEIKKNGYIYLFSK